MSFLTSDDEVHVDEKWFFLTEIDQGLYLTEAKENAPERSTRHKGHILKVMFLTAVARPQFDDTGDCIFDGKIVLWPFVTQQPAVRTSANRARGTMETKVVSVTYDVYLDYFITRVIPAIKAKWPRNHRVGVPIGI
jgi:hypothetical protein